MNSPRPFVTTSCFASGTSSYHLLERNKSPQFFILMEPAKSIACRQFSFTGNRPGPSKCQIGLFPKTWPKPPQRVVQYACRLICTSDELCSPSYADSIRMKGSAGFLL